MHIRLRLTLCLFNVYIGICIYVSLGLFHEAKCVYGWAHVCCMHICVYAHALPFGCSTWFYMDLNIYIGGEWE